MFLYMYLGVCIYEYVSIRIYPFLSAHKQLKQISAIFVKLTATETKDKK